MKKLSTGDDSTLGNYLRLCKQMLGENSAAVAFLNQKIAESPDGENEEVIADEGQMIILLANIKTEGQITTEEEFDALKPMQNHLRKNAPLDGTMFETFGEEEEFVRAQDQSHVWTYISVDDTLLLANGYHHVNRMGYVVTELPYYGPDTEVILHVFEEDTDDTEGGSAD